MKLPMLEPEPDMQDPRSCDPTRPMTGWSGTLWGTYAGYRMAAEEEHVGEAWGRARLDAWARGIREKLESRVTGGGPMAEQALRDHLTPMQFRQTVPLYWREKK